MEHFWKNRWFSALKKRFEEKVFYASPCGCHYWIGNVNHGYGQFKLFGKKQPAHRISYELYTGSRIPDEIKVCHSCDNRLCVNPDHLFLGTQSDNLLDMKFKDRGPGKLKKDDIDQIRHLLSAGVKQLDIARKFSVSRSIISSIKTGNTFKWYKKRKVKEHHIP